VDVAKDDREITVQTMSHLHQRGPVFYASQPHALPLERGTNGGGGGRHRLVSILWDHWVAMESPLGKCCHSSTRDALPIQVVNDPLGKPHLLLGKHRGPAVSFSEGGGKVWAALCGDESDIGIDVAGTDEFRGEYPFHRVFHTQELQHASMVAGGDVAEVSALLWSIKEAVVKALGCGFHLVDPREIHVYPSTEGECGYTFPVSLSGKALMRFPIGTGRSLWVRSLPQGKMWLSIALLNRRHR
jgi:phosphopantetheinyl transferase (holo-ACP synthase)